MVISIYNIKTSCAPTTHITAKLRLMKNIFGLCGKSKQNVLLRFIVLFVRRYCIFSEYHIITYHMKAYYENIEPHIAFACVYNENMMRKKKEKNLHNRLALSCWYAGKFKNILRWFSTNEKFIKNDFTM